MKKNKKQNKGFSLVELVIVVAIMAILVGILAPQYIKYVERSRKSADASNAENFATAVKVANADGNYDIAAATYVITLSNTANVTVLNNTTDASDVFKAAFNEYIGENWNQTKLKSTKWGTTNKNVKVTCKVGANGSVTVTYDPASLASYLGENTVSGN